MLNAYAIIWLIWQQNTAWPSKQYYSYQHFSTKSWKLESILYGGEVSPNRFPDFS